MLVPGVGFEPAQSPQGRNSTVKLTGMDCIGATHCASTPNSYLGQGFAGCRFCLCKWP